MLAQVGYHGGSLGSVPFHVSLRSLVDEVALKEGYLYSINHHFIIVLYSSGPAP
jgi:hypothetical protein